MQDYSKFDSTYINPGRLVGEGEGQVVPGRLGLLSLLIAQDSLQPCSSIPSGLVAEKWNTTQSSGSFVRMLCIRRHHTKAFERTSSGMCKWSLAAHINDVHTHQPRRSSR